MRTDNDMMQLARLLEIEWNGGPVDRVQVRGLAERLLPLHPELRQTLSSIRARMIRA